ncbi:MAG: hypothetical protein ACR2K3_02860 [Nocardioides sp.]
MILGQTDGERRGWGWVAHLRAGGTTPWQAWTGLAEAGGRYLPGAQQLELLRRVNQVSAPSQRLAERVLAASAPGRGRPDLELVGAASPSRFGPAPVDPAALPPDELVRVATSLVADDLVAAGPIATPAPRRTRVVRRRYRIIGDPLVADSVRAELIADGRPPGGRLDRRNGAVVVVGVELSRLLAHTWTARCFAVGAPAWSEWVSVLAAADRLPPRVDLARACAEYAARLEPRRVHVVFDHDQIAPLVGVRHRFVTDTDLPAQAVELARRTAPVLGLLVTPPARRALLERLRHWLSEATGPTIAVPPRTRDWVAERAQGMRRDLIAGGYAVHGDLGVLTAGMAAGIAEPSEEGVLALAIELLLDPREVE